MDKPYLWKEYGHSEQYCWRTPGGHKAWIIITPPAISPEPEKYRKLMG